MLARVWIVCKKELYLYFSTPLAYVLIAAFLFGNGYLFAMSVYNGTANIADGTIYNVALLLLLVTPLLTMRLLAEEQKNGTMELLLTAPIRDSEVILGKFLGSYLFMAVLILLTLIYPLILVFFGNTPLILIVSGYVGLFLFAAVALAIGLFASSLTQSQVVAGLIAFVTLVVMWLLNQISLAVGPPWGLFFSSLGLANHLQLMAQGLLESRDIIFYATLAVGFIALATVSLETRRWR